jgi:cobalamin biosynthesis protein CobT
MVSFFLDDSEYHLTPKEAALVDEEDKKYPPTDEGNTAFNDWFRKFARDRFIHPVNKRMARYWTNTKNSTEDTVKYAVTLRAMRSMVGVVDHKNRNNVTFSEEHETSTWYDDKIILPVGPVKDSPDLHEAINTMGGFAVHEACHSKHTRPVIGNLNDFSLWAKSSPYNMVLANLLEDGRIESVEMEENPGFKGYLDRVMDYMWDKHNPVEGLPSSFSDTDVNHRIQAAITGARIPDRADKELPSSYAPFISEVRKVTDEWIATGEKATLHGLQKMVERMKQVLAITKEDEQKQQQENEEKGEGNTELDKVARQLMPCGESRKPDAGVTRIENEKITALADEEVESLDPKKQMFLPTEGVGNPSITVRRPRLSSYPVQLPKIDNFMAKAKAALEFRKATPRADERMMLSGELDEDEVYRLFADDMRVFRNITEEVLPSAAVYLLVDMSGSMRGRFSYNDSSSRIETTYRIDVAFKMAYLLVRAMQSKPNVTVRVLGHTGDNEESDRRYRDSHGYDDVVEFANFYRIWEQGDPIDRLKIIQQIDMGNNYDSYAIAWAGNLLEQEDAEQKLLIVLSDGQPAGMAYGGDPAERHVRKVVDHLERKGITAFNVSMAAALTDETQARMYKHFVPAPEGTGNAMYHKMLTTLQKLLSKIGTR